MQYFQIIVSFISFCFLAALSLYCFANAALRLRGNLPGELKWILEKSSSVDQFVIAVVTIIIISLSLVGVSNHISNHVILSLDILFLFNSLIVILYNIIKQMGFALGK